MQRSREDMWLQGSSAASREPKRLHGGGRCSRIGASYVSKVALKHAC